MGRERLISPKDATDIRETYASPRRQPNGRFTSMDVLARLHGVSVGTIQQIVDYKGVYSADANSTGVKRFSSPCRKEMREMMDKIVIEKDHPIPPKVRKKSRWNEVMKDMNIGDSFVASPIKASRHPNSLRSSIYSAAKKMGIKVLMRKIDPGKYSGGRVRVWRIE